jgi:uncharacterized membrane protein YkoI
MHEKTRHIVTGVAALAAAGGLTAGIAGAAKESGATKAKPADGRGAPFERRAPETALTGEAKDNAEAAALAAVPGGKVLRSEEDGDGVAKYEVHMTDADGKPVDVYLDADFAVTEKRAGRMGGHPGGPRGHHGTPLTGDAADKAKAAALAELPGAEVLEASEEESSEVAGAKYEVHVIRKDGTPAEVLLDADFKVLKVLDRPAFRHRGGPGGPGGPPHAAELTGDTAAKAKAAAEAAVPDGTARGSFAAGERAPDNAKYAVIVTKQNGRPVIVLLDAEFKVVKKVSGPPRGRHGFRPDGPPPGAPGAGYPGAPPAETTSS